MKNNELKIRTLLDRFYDGETTLGEEQELYAYFRDCRDLPDDLRQQQQMFLDLAAIQLGEKDSLPVGRNTTKRWLHWAAAIAILIIGGAAVLFAFRRQAEDEYVAYIYGERVTDRDVVLSEMQRTMAVVSSDGGDIVEEQLKSMFAN